MSGTFIKIQTLVRAGNYTVSDHAYEELMKDAIQPHEIVMDLDNAIVIEDYPDAHRGPTVLVLCQSANGTTVHSVWGMFKADTNMAVLITAYVPDPVKWKQGFRQRVRK